MKYLILGLALISSSAHAFEDPACMRRCGGGDINRQAQCIQLCEYAPAAPAPILDTWRVPPLEPSRPNYEDLRPTRDQSSEVDDYIRARSGGGF